MSFLDCMSCGFGAVILFFMIINAQVREYTEDDPTDLMAETKLVEEEILEGRKNLVLAKNTIEKLEEEKRDAQGRIDEVIALIAEMRAELSRYDSDTLARVERVERLQADIKSLEEEVKRLLALAEQREDRGDRIRRFDDEGEGDRQYLTGVKLNGTRTLILVDRSASMLDDTIVNIIRRRNMSRANKLGSIKWRQAVASVDWLTAQIRPDTEFQIYMFNNDIEPVIPGSDGVWLSASDNRQLDEAVKVLRNTVPEGGTNMHAVWDKVAGMTPQPDNVVIIADGLPTMDDVTTSRRTISGKDRATLFSRALRNLPSGIPVNVLLFPLEGDYQSPIMYWNLANNSGGSFVAVSRDWP